MAIRHNCQSITLTAVVSSAAGGRPGRVGIKAILSAVLGIVAIAFGIITIGNSLFHWDRGTRLAVTDKEEIYYKNVSKEDAERLGQVLKDIGYFTGGSAKTVQLTKNDNLYVLNFVVKDGFWDNADFVDAMRINALRISSRAFEGQPVEMCLSDQKMDLRKTVSLEKDSLGKWLAVSPQEEIYYRDVTEEQAKKIGELLLKLGYFDGKTGGTVTVARDAGKVRLTLVVVAGTWDNDRAVREHQATCRRIRQEVFSNEPMELCFADELIRVKKTVAVE